MIELSSNHKRAISSTLFLMEKMIEEIAFTLNNSKEMVMQKTEHNLNPEQKASIMETLELIKTEITRLASKYQLNQQTLVESNFINARKSKAWEMLHNTKSKHLNAFGEFPKNLSKEFDSDLDNLLKLIGKL